CRPVFLWSPTALARLPLIVSRAAVSIPRSNQGYARDRLPFGRIVAPRPADTFEDMEKFPLHRATWPFIALIASAAMLATAHAFEPFLLPAPCPPCHNQRQIYWAAGTIALIAVFLNWRGAPPRLMSTMCVLLGIVFLTGAGIAGYHALVEWRILPAP